MAKKSVKEMVLEIKEERIKMCSDILVTIKKYQNGKTDHAEFTDDALKLIYNLVWDEKCSADYLDEGL